MGKPAARLGDSTMHGSPLLGACCPTVLIGGKPAWRITDQHTCPIPNAPPPAGPGTPHGPGMTTLVPDGGAGVCLIGGKPAARMGDIVMEPGAIVPLPPPNTIVMGCPTVLIGMVGAGAGALGDRPTGARIASHKGPRKRRVMLMCLVDLPTGRLGLTETDWELPLPLPLKQVRAYRSTNRWRGDLGSGWGHTWGVRFWSSEPNVATLRMPDGRRANVELPDPWAGALNPVEQVFVNCLPANQLPWKEVRSSTDQLAYLVQLPDTPTMVFSDRSVGDQGFVWLGMCDRSSNWVRIISDQVGRPQLVEAPWQRMLRLERNARGLLTEIWLESPSAPHPGVCLVKYGYDEALDLTTVEDESGICRYSYRDHLLVGHADPAGGTCLSEYDAKRRCTLTSGPKGIRRRRYDYDPLKRETRVTDSVGATTIHRANEQGMVVEVENPAGGKSTFSYNDSYQIVRATDQVGHVTEFIYGANGAMLSKISPAGLPDAIETNERGEVIRHLSPGGVPLLEVTRDDLGRVLTQSIAGRGTTKFAWNADGTIKATTLPTGQRIASAWDDELRVHTETDAQWLIRRRTYDVLGRISEFEDAAGNKTKVVYDGAGHLHSIVHADGTQTRLRMDAEGNLLEAIDEAGVPTEYRYDAAHQVIDKRIGGTVVGTVEYDSEKRAVRAAGQDGIPYEFTYDLLGNMVRQAFPDGRVEEYRYDATGRLIQLMDPRGDVVQADYDQRGKLVSVVYPDGSEKKITRNEDGRWLTVQLGDFVCEREYDARGRIARETQNDFFHESEYNDAELRTGVTGSDGRRMEFAYDDQGAVAEMIVRQGRWRDDSWESVDVDRRHAFAYDRLGRCMQWTMPGDKREQRAYDKRGRLVSQEVYCGQRRIVARTYAYDAAGRLVHRTDDARGESRYEYDWRNRLIAVREGHREERYRFDDRGDLTGDRVHYLPGHRVEQWGDVRFTYDARGFVIARQRAEGIDEFDYGYQGLLTGFRAQGGPRIEYRYDGLARLCAKDKTEGRTVYRWDRNQLWSIREGEGRTIEFAYLPDELTPREQIVDGTAYTIHTDHLGRAMEMIDDSGAVVWRNQQDVWGRGRTPGSAPPVECLCESPGQFWDADVNLYYLRYRMYDPLTAHFVVPDPSGIWGGLDAYASPFDPVNTMDPTGLECKGGKENEPTVWRGSAKRPPSEICKDGFVPHDPMQTVLQHVNGGCGWISTAYESSSAETFAHAGAQKYGGKPFVYMIDNPGCGVEADCDPEVIQHQKDVGADPVADTEHEVCFNKPIQGKNILGYYDASIGPSSFQVC